MLLQILTFSLIAAGLAWLVFNTITNLETRKIATGWGFLDQEARFAIGESPISYSPASSYGRALLVGFFNTLKVAVIGIVLASLLGISVGILLLSKNWLVRKVIGAYISFMRNIPVLLHLILWYRHHLSAAVAPAGTGSDRRLFLSQRRAQLSGAGLRHRSARTPR